jgi:hypothetical protein
LLADATPRPMAIDRKARPRRTRSSPARSAEAHSEFVRGWESTPRRLSWPKERRVDASDEARVSVDGELRAAPLPAATQPARPMSSGSGRQDIRHRQRKGEGRARLTGRAVNQSNRLTVQSSSSCRSASRSSASTRPGRSLRRRSLCRLRYSARREPAPKGCSPVRTLAVLVDA